MNIIPTGDIETSIKQIAAALPSLQEEDGRPITFEIHSDRLLIRLEGMELVGRFDFEEAG